MRPKVDQGLYAGLGRRRHGEGAPEDTEREREDYSVVSFYIPCSVEYIMRPRNITFYV